MTQGEALTILKTGANVFLTGEPGSGKTHAVNQYIGYLREHGIEPAITASTGIAATHIGGFTVHSWSGIGIRKTLSKYDLDIIASNERAAKRVVRAKVLIIDEISMLDAEILESVDKVCRAVKNSDRAFGGMQVVFVGDFFQLPPVAGDGALPARFAFLSGSWEAARPVVCYLSEQHRQEDGVFLEILSALRKGFLGARHKEFLSERLIQLGDYGHLSVTKLFPHNLDVDRVNDSELEKLPGKSSAFVMYGSGPGPLVEQLKRGCLSPERLILKIGAHVMFTKNNFESRFVNGTTGKITGFRKRDGAPLVRTISGEIIPAEPMEWTIADGRRVLAKIEQVPLRLAWAITVHKSQGMSLDAAFIDLSGAFEYGQGYVALSRVRSLKGLYLGGLNGRALEVHPDVLSRDGNFRASSEGVKEELRAMDSQKIAKLHEDFIRAFGGKIAASIADPTETGWKKSADRKKASTLEATLELVSRKLPLAQIAKERALTLGTILNHLEKLVSEKKIAPARDLAHIKPEQNRFEKAKSAFEAVYKKEGRMLLSPARDMLGEDFSFEELRLARLFL